MHSRVTFRMDFREFDAALKQYMQVTTHSLPDVVNKKAFFVARRAVIETPKANKQKLVSDLRRRRQVGSKILGQRVRITKTGVKRGKLITQKIMGGPLAAMIINLRRGLKGEPGLYGPEMEEAMNSLISARVKSVAFLKSGWLPAIRILYRVVHDRAGGPALNYRGAEQIGLAKGSAQPATPGFTCKAVIENAADARRDVKEALVVYGGPALQRAFDFEARSMMQEVARRQYEEGRKIGIKIVGG